MNVGDLGTNMPRRRSPTAETACGTWPSPSCSTTGRDRSCSSGGNTASSTTSGTSPRPPICCTAKMAARRVVVVGAGPAGSAAAMALLRYRGLEVVLLDRASFPRRKVCGSGLSPWALAQLDELGVGPAVRREAYTIRGALIGGASGE